jgi:two-component system, sporulation sensor kinase A
MDLSAVAELRLNLALEEADRLQRLLNEILNYTKCQTLNVIELDLNTLISEMLEPIREMPAAQNKDIKFTPTDTPAVVIGDKDKLKQVFINLICNACEAVNENEIVNWSVQQSAKEVSVKVHNGGELIPADKIEQITKPFFTTKSAGNGLGLAIVKRIVEAHSGHLEIESNILIGTVVGIKIPKQQQ